MMKRRYIMKKIIFFDIDGTLQTEDERSLIPESTVSAIAKARENGHLAFINTGRTAFNISDRIKSIGFDGYICGCGTYIEYGGEILLYNALSHEYCRRISEFLIECRAIPVYEYRDCLYFDKRAEETDDLRHFKNVFLDKGIPTDRDVSESCFSFDKFVFWKKEDTDYEKLVNVIGKDFMVIDRGDGFYECVPNGFTKATGIKIILEKLGISIENAYAIGDSMNDLPMLEAVPNSIAMGGAERIYPYVSFITKSVDEDGIEFALRHFGII
jgi:hypothetical protein